MLTTMACVTMKGGALPLVSRVNFQGKTISVTLVHFTRYPLPGDQAPRHYVHPGSGEAPRSALLRGRDATILGK